MKTLGEVLGEERGRIFCSTEEVARCREVYTDSRVTVTVKTSRSALKVRLELSTVHITSDTLRSRLYHGTTVSIIAIFDRREGNILFFRPLVIGAPWLVTEDPKVADAAMWWGYEFYENFVEDFDEFSRVTTEPLPDDCEPMRDVSERAFKVCLGKVLGDPTVKDWGGEKSDHFTAHLHLKGRRLTAAFLLKGPSRFAPMTLVHTGKNKNQIVRLASEPADVLFIQHCHEITADVRSTLRAFAVQPSRPRRYCLIDGRDALRLLRAYGLFDNAVEMTRLQRERKHASGAA